MRLAWIALFAGAAASAAVAYGILSWTIVNVDAPIFGIAAKRLLAGQRLYVDFFEAKPPLATLFYAIPGAIWPRSYLAICMLLAAIVVLQGAIWIWQLRPRFLTAAACLLFVVLYPITFADFSWTSTEHISNLFITVVLVLSVAMFQADRAAWWQCLLAGAAACAAFHCRQNAVLCFAVPLAVVLTMQQPAWCRLRAVGWLVLGGFAAWAVMLAVVWVISDLEGYFFQVFVFPQRFTQIGGRRARFELIAGMGPHSLPALFGLAAGLALLGRYRRLAIAGILVGVLTCVLSPRVHYHYWANLFPFVAMCLLLGLPRNDAKTPFLQLAALAVIGASVTTGSLRLVPVVLSGSDLRPLEEVANWIDANSREGDTLYVFSPMSTEYVPFRSRLLPANKYTVGWEIDWNNGMMADSFEEILRSYLRNPPTIFVIHKDEMIQMAEAKSLSQNLARRGGQAHFAPKTPQNEPVPDGFGIGSKADRAKPIKRSIRLALELMQTHRYDHVKELNGFHIHVLRGPADRSGT